MLQHCAASPEVPWNPKRGPTKTTVLLTGGYNGFLVGLREGRFQLSWALGGSLGEDSNMLRSRLRFPYLGKILHMVDSMKTRANINRNIQISFSAGTAQKAPPTTPLLLEPRGKRFAKIMPAHGLGEKTTC